MVKKILFILFLSISSLTFSQEKLIDKVFAAPNPFKNTTTISFTSTSKTAIIFTVKNVLGKTVFSQHINCKKGKNSISFSKGNLLSGMYIYSIQNKNRTTSKRLVIK